jgi:hypothetical protein
MALLVALAMAVFASTVRAAEPQCLRYGPEVVSLSGTVIYRTFSDAAGQPERVLLLLLDEPICVEALNDERSDLYVDEGDQIVIHLNMGPAVSGQEQILSGQRASVSGTLYHRHTSHHHADLVLLVKQFNVTK